MELKSNLPFFRAKTHSPPTHDSEKHKKRVLRVSRAKKEPLEAEKKEETQTEDSKKHEDEESKRESQRNRRRLRHQATKEDHKETHQENEKAKRVGKENADKKHEDGKATSRPEKPKVDSAKPKIDHAARARRRSAAQKHDDKSHDGAGAKDHHAPKRHPSSTDAPKAPHSIMRDRKGSHNKEEEHAKVSFSGAKSGDGSGQSRDRKGSHGRDDRLSRERKGSHSKVDDHAKEGSTSAKTADSHGPARDRKGSHSRGTESRNRKGSHGAPEKRASFTSKGRAATVAPASTDEKRRDFKQRSASTTHDATQNKPR